ncbi:MAG: hypothetical protein IPP59_11300 [Betaproteobacteria bacterium]|nr:hypothetical protein [Candidatus Dechloromonas phosphorivorans]
MEQRAERYAAGQFWERINCRYCAKSCKLPGWHWPLKWRRGRGRVKSLKPAIDLDRSDSHSQKISPFQQTIKLAAVTIGEPFVVLFGPKNRRNWRFEFSNQQQTPGRVSAFHLCHVNSLGCAAVRLQIAFSTTLPRVSSRVN